LVLETWIVFYLNVKKANFFDSVCECRVVVVINLMTTFNIEEEKTLIDFFCRCGIFVTLSI